MTIEKLIENRLNKTLGCEFKKWWIPKGWACIHIKKFAKELAKEIKKEVRGKEKIYFK